jgi:hypothetical protein
MSETFTVLASSFLAARIFYLFFIVSILINPNPLKPFKCKNIKVYAAKTYIINLFENLLRFLKMQNNDVIPTDKRYILQ